MNDLEFELIKNGNQIDKSKSIQEVERLFLETKKKLENTKKDELTEKIRKLSQVSPSDKKELTAAERVIKEIFKDIDKTDKADFPPYFSEKHLSEAKKGLIDFRIKIDEERDRLKIHSNVFTTDNLNKISEKISPQANLEEIRLAFWDGAEDKIYNKLLDDDNVSFELRWEKEKVNFSIIGEETEKGPNKIEIDFFPPSPGYRDHALLEILNIKPEFAGTVKISYKGPVKDKDKLGEEITSLKNRINTLEEQIKQKFIEHLKTLFEDCQVYFDIQEKSIVINHQRTKEERQQEPQKEAEFRQIIINLQRLRSAGRTDLPEPPPVNVEDIYGDVKLEKEEEKAREKEAEDLFLALANSEIEQIEKKSDELRKSIHKDFTEKLQRQ
ncbi:11275_t:CDS:2 [Entrophospora sp. SA101]|nr:12684_t:CDS:2 [Entrophospora sp. SA101]CAJ0869264.1 11275_t:CDS:2 [Entrophospora sp. SA101]